LPRLVAAQDEAKIFEIIPLIPWYPSEKKAMGGKSMPVISLPAQSRKGRARRPFANFHAKFRISDGERSTCQKSCGSAHVSGVL
jgi:hypothetical protein